MLVVRQAVRERDALVRRELQRRVGKRDRKEIAMAQSPERKAEYDKMYGARPEQKKRRAMRNAARRKMEEKGLVHKGDGKDVDHKRMLRDGGTNSTSNLRVVSAEKNRGWKKGKSGKCGR